MLGILLKKHGWHRKPVTHAAILWVLVGFAALMLIVFSAYAKNLASIKSGEVQAKPAKAREAKSLPSAFGTVMSFDGSTITIDSKQAYGRILIDELTEVSVVGGEPFDLAGLEAGMTVMATGNDAGDAIIADALVILTKEALDSTTD